MLKPKRIKSDYGDYGHKKEGATTLSRTTFSKIIKRDTKKNGSVIMPIVANKPFMLSVLVLNVVAPSRILGRTLNL
jgi:hypothetical protein